jgi:hypothetical protein
MDQASFVGLRALGRQPVLLFTWVSPQRLDGVAVQRFNENLARGFLGRLLQRSPLPWGRHRWVANSVPAPVLWFPDPLPVERLPEWRNALAEIAVDPEHGPAWRLAVQSIDGGGSALSILVSHTIADGLGTVQAIASAVRGEILEYRFPAPSSRWSLTRLARDGTQSLRALPDVWRALKALASGAGLKAATLRPAAEHQHSSIDPMPGVTVTLPLVRIMMDSAQFEERASNLKITHNTLITALAAQLALRMGRVDTTGRVKLVLPVSDRRPGDWRGNALRSVTVITDPLACRSNPRILQTGIKAALTTLHTKGDTVSDVIPLVPYIPLWLARRVERKAVRTDLSVGCSLLGELPPELSEPCGKASLFEISLVENFTAGDLDRLGGQLFLLAYRLGGKSFITVSAYSPGCITTPADLTPLVRDALVDIGLPGTVG